MSDVSNPRALLAVAVVSVAFVVLVAGGSEGGPDGPARTVRSELTLESVVVPTSGELELLAPVA